MAKLDDLLKACDEVAYILAYPGYDESIALGHARLLLRTATTKATEATNG